MLTLTDLFCGAGGSSTGAVAVPGVQVRIAANHWNVAVELHNANHPTADHAAVDLHQENPAFFPRTDLLWASPECTKWSQAGGSKNRPAIEEGLFEDPHADDAATRSRLLMFDVLKFIEHHRYAAVVVENVVDIAVQSRYQLAWAEWRRQLSNLGYRHRVVSLNSMHAQLGGLPAPQSRDRIYIVCWREGVREPDLERVVRPQAWCPRCERMVEARQSWKNGRSVGRYRQAYVFVHGDGCGAIVEPGWLPAAAAIDWDNPGTRIGDRTRPLSAKTKARIAAGIARYWRPFTLEAAGNTYERTPGVRTWPADHPVTTLTTTATKALLVPVEGRDGKEASPAHWPGRTQTTRNETGVAVMPPFIAELRGGSSDARPVMEPAATFCASGTHHGLVVPSGGTWNEDATSTDEHLRTLTTREAYALVMRNNTGGAEMSTPVTEYMRTLTTAGHQSLIQQPRPREGRRPVTVQALAEAEAMVDECLFRMLTPREIAAGMAFPDDYIWHPDPAVKISDRILTKAAGNAVTPPAARDIVGAVAAALT